MKKSMLLIFVTLFCCTALFAYGESGVTSDQVIAAARTALDGSYSYHFEYLFHYPLWFIQSYQIDQVKGQDESMSFHVQQAINMPVTHYEDAEERMYYYQFEGETYVCYVQAQDATVLRMTLSPEEHNAMKNDGLRITGGAVLLPKEMTAVQLTEKDGAYVIDYWITVADAASCNEMLASYIQMAGTLVDVQIPGNTPIHCRMELNSEMQPVAFAYDFSDIKPLVFGDSELSYEYAMGMNLMTMCGTFNYELQPCIPLPETYSSYTIIQVEE